MTRSPWPLFPPAGRGHVKPRPLRSHCPYMEVATWPGARCLWGQGLEGQRGGKERRWAEPQGVTQGRSGGS